MALARPATVIRRGTAIQLAVLCGGLVTGCATSHCAPAARTDASAETEPDAPPSCASDRGRLIIGPMVGLDGNAGVSCEQLVVTVYDGAGVPVAGFERGCSSDASFIDLGTWPRGRYQLAVAAPGLIGGGGELIHPTFCTGPEELWRGCSPLWVDITPCGLSVVPVTLVCDQATLSDCR
jgi:hypothetical protein